MDLLSGKSPDGFHGLRWNMLVSGGLCRTPPRINMPIWPLSHQDIPGFESGGFQWNLLDSGSFRRRRWGSVQSSCTIYIYSLYMLTYSQNTSQLKEWFSYHKFMYFGPCARCIGHKRMIKHSVLRFLVSTSTSFHLCWLYVSYSLQIPF